MKDIKNYSGKQVIKAGEMLIDPDITDDKFEEALDILSYWRFSHEKPLADALNLLQSISLKIDKSAIFAKRLKRFISIKNKLLRFETMKLKNMQDIGGCRAVVANTKKLTQIVRALRNRNEFKNFKGEIRYKDYVKNPKEDGYRSYHLIGYFNNDKEVKNIEVQIRTRLQHDWATALEIVDLFTNQSLKSNQGRESWKEFFKNVSEQFALMEGIHLFDLNNTNKTKEYLVAVNKSEDFKKSFLIVNKLSNELGVIQIFEGFANSLEIVSNRLENIEDDGYVLIELDIKLSQVTTTFFHRNNNQDAENAYLDTEKRCAGKKHIVVALVSASSVGEIKEAYPNYFADSTDFLKHLLLITEPVQSEFLTSL